MALFDPRIKGQHWPEPNDDPNIPYNWSLSGYQVGDTEAPAEEAPPVAISEEVRQQLTAANERANRLRTNNQKLLKRLSRFKTIAYSVYGVHIGINAYWGYARTPNKSLPKRVLTGIGRGVAAGLIVPSFFYSEDAIQQFVSDKVGD